MLGNPSFACRWRGKWLLTAGLLLLVVLLPPAPSVAATASARQSVITGLFGLWAWGNWGEAFNLLKANGFDVAVGVSSWKTLDQAQQQGLKCIVDFGLTAEVASDDKRWAEYLSGLRAKVLELRGHPALYAWYPVDEPDWQKIPLEKIQQIRELILSLDPSHPIFTVVTLPDRWAPYLRYFDIVAVDPYLKIKGSSGRPDTPAKVTDYLRKVRADLAEEGIKRPVWAVLGAFDTVPRHAGIPRVFRKPSPDEMQQMIDLALAEQVDGLLFWTLSYRNNERYLDWRLPDDPLWETVRRLPARLRPVRVP